jgi:glycosyltransferase involved in cell wall biosynthesis
MSHGNENGRTGGAGANGAGHTAIHDVSTTSARARLIGVILTKDEEAHIGACIDSLAPWVDAVVVWDSGSSDATSAIARRRGAQVVHRPFDNYAAQRQAVLDSLNAEWILFLDADERMTSALGEELKAMLAGVTASGPAPPPHMAGCWLPRRNFIAGKEVRGGGFFPDYQLRLLRRDRAHYDLAREVHETVTVEGDEAYAEQPLLHYNYATWPQFHRKQHFYARYEARILAARRVRPRPHNFILQPLREFRRRYISLRGYRDGLHGLRLALLLAWYYGALPYFYLLDDPDLSQSA